jgi:hypothetical protein
LSVFLVGRLMWYIHFRLYLRSLKKKVEAYTTIPRPAAQNVRTRAPDIAVGRVKICSDGTDLPIFLAKICSDSGRDLPPNFQGSFTRPAKCQPRPLTRRL